MSIVFSLSDPQMRAYFKHHGMGIEVLPLGIDEEQKSLKTVEECMVFFADVGLMRRSYINSIMIKIIKKLITIIII